MNTISIIAIVGIVLCAVIIAGLLWRARQAFHNEQEEETKRKKDFPDEFQSSENHLNQDDGTQSLP